MRLVMRRKILAALALGWILTWSAGCSSTSPVSAPPAKAEAPLYAMVDLQKVMDSHPARPRLRQMEQSLAEAADKAAGETTLMETARGEFDVAMKVRQNEDKTALEKKQTQLGDELNEQRRLFIEALEAEYRPLLFNLDLKLKTVQLSPVQSQSLQKEKEQLETQRNGKLTAKETELKERFNREMDAFAADLSRRTEAYANQWMAERRQRIQNESVSSDEEKQRQEILELSGRMIQDARMAVAKIAAMEKIEIVWLKQAVRQPVKDITDSVIREIANVK